MKDFDLGTFEASASGLDAFFESEPTVVTPLQSQTSPLTAAKAPEPKRASFRKRVASLEQLDGFIRVAEDQLVNKSSQDLWSLKQDGTGQYYIERMFDDAGGPLKG